MSLKQQFVQLSQRIRQLYEQGQYEQALEMAIELREQIRQHLGEEDPSFASSVNSMAVLYEAIGNYAYASSLYRQALQLRRTFLGKEHPSVAITLDNLGGLYFNPFRDNSTSEKRNKFRVTK